MRYLSTTGSTLVEFIIVVVVIGLLAAVLIPNLFSARTAAQDRTAQGYGSHVYTAIHAWLAEGEDTSYDDIPTAAQNCGDRSLAFQIGEYSVPSVGGALAETEACSIEVDGDEVTVTIVSANNKTYVNGQN